MCTSTPCIIHKIAISSILQNQKIGVGLAKNAFYGNLPRMAKIVIEVKKNPNENNASILRRFSRRIQESGIIRNVKKNRYNQRQESKLKIKRSALKKMSRRREIEKLKKLGKMK